MVLGRTGQLLPVEVDQPCTACPGLLRLGKVPAQGEQDVKVWYFPLLLRMLKRS